MNAPAIALLDAVRARLADPARHAIGAYARDAAGRPVQPTSPRAVCWCVIGALLLEAPDNTVPRQDAKAALFASARALLGEDVGPEDVNDIGHAETLSLLADARSRLS